MRKISRRNFLLASGAVTISAALSACGGSSSSTGAASSAAASSAASAAPAAQGKVLNIWCWNDEFQGRFNNYYPEVASIAEDKSTTTLKDGTVVKWTINANENNNYQNKLDEALLSQDSAADDDKIDIFLIEADYALKYVDSDYVLDVKSDIGLTDSDLAGQYQYTKDIVTVDGQPLRRDTRQVYLMLNKPRGYVTTLSDERGRRTAAELVSGCGARVYPVGRLDLNSEGLLLLTNDGELANRLTHPKKEVDKVYLVWLSRYIPGCEASIASPIEIDGRTTRPAKVETLRAEDETALLRITIHEGRNRQIRRLCELSLIHI